MIRSYAGRGGLLLGLWFWGMGVAPAQDPAPEVYPTIISATTQIEARLMDRRGLAVGVNRGGDPRAVDYDWQIVSEVYNDGSGPKARIVPNGAFLLSTQPEVTLELWWCSPGPSCQGQTSTALAMVPAQIQVRLRVRFVDQEEWGPPDTTQRLMNVAIVGVNQPPIPHISGRLGTPEDRIPTGQAVHASSEGTIQPNAGDRLQGGMGANWLLRETQFIPGGGTYVVSPVPFGTDTSDMSFTVPQMTGPINQRIELVVLDGLHRVSTSAYAYLTNASTPPPTGNRVPTLSLPQTSKTVTPGSPAVMEAIGTDLDGDNLAFDWVFIQGSTTTTLTQGIVSTRTSSTDWRSTLTYSTTGLAQGTYRFRVRVREVASAQAVSPWGEIVVNVQEGGGTVPPPPDVTVQRGTCSGNLGPELLSVTPSDRTLPAGQQSLTVVFRDTTQTTGFGGATITGVPEIEFSFGNLTALGVGPVTQGAIQLGAGPTEGRRSLNMTVPAGAQGSATVSVTALDVLGCQTTATIPLAFQSSQVGTLTPRMTYAIGSNVVGPVSHGHVVPNPVSAGSVNLTASVAEGDASGVTFAWALTGPAGVTLSPQTGVNSVLTIGAGVTGPAVVTLTATDSTQRSGSAQVTFNVQTQAGTPPTATIASAPSAVRVGQTFEVQGQGQSGGGSGSLTYRWDVVGSDGQQVEYFWNHGKARIRTPFLSPDTLIGEVTIGLTVIEDGQESERQEVKIPVDRMRIHFPQVAVGPMPGQNQQQFETSLVVVNDSPVDAFCRMSFFPTGQSGSDTSATMQFNKVTADGDVPLDEGEFLLPAGEAREFSLDYGDNSSLLIGWLRLETNVRLAGHLFYRVVSLQDGRLVNEVPILPMQGNTFKTALSPGANPNLALAIVNVSGQESSFKLVANDGSTIETYDIPLEAGEHLARFLPEIFDVHSSGGLRDRFRGGTLTIIPVDEDAVFAVTLIKTTDAGIPLAILPVSVVGGPGSQ
jgi:hypothetical protein